MHFTGVNIIYIIKGHLQTFRMLLFRTKSNTNKHPHHLVQY